MNLKTKNSLNEQMKTENKLLPAISTQYGSATSRSSFKLGSSRSSLASGSYFSSSPDPYNHQQSENQVKPFENLELQPLSKNSSKKHVSRYFSDVYKGLYLLLFNLFELTLYKS